MKVGRNVAVQLIKNCKFKFFSVDFVKKDGTLRHMTCRLGVSKHVKGVGLTYNPEDKRLIVVWDTVAQGYRNINQSTIKRVRISGVVYDVAE